MWIFLSDSFVSVVADRNDPARLLVRARRPGDIEAFLAPVTLPREFAVTESPDADYKFRAFVPREVIARATVAHASAIDYSNFKNTVREPARHSAYMDVWSVMHAYQGEP